MIKLLRRIFTCYHDHYTWGVDFEPKTTTCSEQGCENIDHTRAQVIYWRIQECLRCGHVNRVAGYASLEEAVV